MGNCKVEFLKDHASLLNWTAEPTRETKDENGLDLEFRKSIKTRSKSWVADCKTYLGSKDLPCPWANHYRHPACLRQAAGTAEGRQHQGLGHRKLPAWILPQAGDRSAGNLDLRDGVAFPKAELSMVKGTNATSLCCILLTGISDCFSCLPDEHFLLVERYLLKQWDWADFHRRQVWNQWEIPLLKNTYPL